VKPRLPSTKVAIAGGHGFIGKHLVDALRRDGHEVRAFGPEGFEAPCDVLIWAAGGRSAEADALEEAHVAAPARTVRACRPRTVVYLSTAAVYGRAEVPFRESSPPSPQGPYAEAKWRGERAVREACDEVGARLFVLRLAVVYGPGQRSSMLLPSAVASLVAGEPFDASEGLQTRDFLEVSDAVALVRRCLEEDAPPGVYNAGTGHEVPVRSVLLALADAIGPDRRTLLRLGALPLRSGEAERSVLAPDLAVELLGWRARVDLADGLRRLVEDERARV